MSEHVIRLVVKVRPNARASVFEQVDGEWRAQVRAAPVDDRANAELVALVARHFGCSRADVSIDGGRGGRTKRLRVRLPSARAERRERKE